MLDLEAIKRAYAAAGQHLGQNWACCSGHALGMEVPVLIAEIEGLRTEVATVRRTAVLDIANRIDMALRGLPGGKSVDALCFELGGIVGDCLKDAGEDVTT